MPNPPGGAALHLTRNAVDALPEGELGRQLAEGRPLRVKLGVDPTTPDIHLGHTVVLREAAGVPGPRPHGRADHRRLHRARGGPERPHSARPFADPEEIDRNAETYQEQAFKVLDRDRTEVRRNGEWLDMADGRPVPPRAHVHRRPAARARRLRQALRRRRADHHPRAPLPAAPGLRLGGDRSDVELGGTDQKFNLLLGRDIQQAYGVPPQSILTMPILPGIDGVQKMSKSLGNYVGVTEPPEEIFGKLMRVPDDAMPVYYDLLMDEPMDPATSRRATRSARLARALTERLHGEEAAPPRRRASSGVHVEHAPPTRWRSTPSPPRTARSTCPRCSPMPSASRAPRDAGCSSQAGVRLDGVPDRGRTHGPPGR